VVEAEVVVGISVVGVVGRVEGLEVAFGEAAGGRWRMVPAPFDAPEEPSAPKRPIKGHNKQGWLLALA